MGDVFISYAWDGVIDLEVEMLANWLRDNGFEADFDKQISQQHTAINFNRMMHEAMQKYDKVIIVLSQKYKEKAEGFKDGLGTEYQMLLGDIEQSPKKYILLSFSGRPDSIIPFALRGRDIIDFSSNEQKTSLLRKLANATEFELNPVKVRPDLKPRASHQYPSPVDSA
ncbi:MAG: toll/interleukin-1 receptor domain-containing protein, partial [Panacibacter sp.]